MTTSFSEKSFSRIPGTRIPRKNSGALQKHERTGRPLGSRQFTGELEKKLGRELTPGKPGPKPKKK
ncbi:MAG: hypothetical protein R6U29_12800 [Desulfosudaceae bacterium]